MRRRIAHEASPRLALPRRAAFTPSTPAPFPLFVVQAEEQLALVNRQSVIAGFYKAEQSVMEVLEQKRRGGAGDGTETGSGAPGLR